MVEVNVGALARPENSQGAKPRVRLKADGTFVPLPSGKAFVQDSFENFLTRTGVNSGNIGSAGTYGFNPVSRNRLKIEWAYRGSWVVGLIVDCVAEDMTRDLPMMQCEAVPEQIHEFESDQLDALGVQTAMCQTIKLARLYGGSIGFIMIDGQDPATPLDPGTVGKGQFRGIFPLDRWAVFPWLAPDGLVTEMGPDLGMPAFYDVRPDYGMGFPPQRIHYSRCIRLDGVWLPYWQRIAENLWGQSVIERLWDRLIAFDSGTNGAAQLLYKAHLRSYKIAGLRKLIAAGGPGLDAVIKQLEVIRRFQSSEGLTIMDAEDEFDVHPYSFDGIDDVLLQFGQQLSGAAQIPLVRLFGQSPAGLNSTGESDLRTYYDNINRQQNGTLHQPMRRVYHVAWRSQFGKDPPKGWKLVFEPLWQMDDQQRAEVAERTTNAIMAPFTAGVTARSTTLKELRQNSRNTGMWTNITDDMIRDAEAEDNEQPPDPIEQAAALHEATNPEPDDDAATGPGQKAKPGGKSPPTNGAGRA